MRRTEGLRRREVVRARVVLKECGEMREDERGEVGVRERMKERKDESVDEWRR